MTDERNETQPTEAQAMQPELAATAAAEAAGQEAPAAAEPANGTAPEAAPQAQEAGALSEDDRAMAAIRASGRRFRYCDDDVYGEEEDRPAGTGAPGEGPAPEVEMDARIAPYFADRPDTVRRAGAELFRKHLEQNSEYVFVGFTLVGQQVHRAMKLAESRRIGRLVQMGLTAVLAVIFGVSFAMRRLQSDLIFALLCLGLFVFEIFSPTLAARSAVRQYGEGRGCFMLIGDKTVLWCNGESYYKYERGGKDKLRVYEDDELLVFAGGRGAMYLLPKAAATPDELDTIRRLLADEMAKR